MPKSPPPDHPLKVKIAERKQQLMLQQPKYGSYANQLLAERQCLKEWAISAVPDYIEDADSDYMHAGINEVADGLREGKYFLVPMTPSSPMIAQIGLSERMKKEIAVFYAWFYEGPVIYGAWRKKYPEGYSELRIDMRRYGMDILASMSDAEIDRELAALEDREDTHDEADWGAELSRQADANYTGIDW